MKRFFVSILIAFGLLGALILSVFLGLGFYLSPQSKLVKSDAIIVISGGRTTNRADEGINLFKQGLADKIIFSGAALDDGPSNALAMKIQALNEGIPANAILTDEDSKNTYQNAINAKRILEEIGAKKIILVTSPYHQRRAYMTFEKVLGKSYQILNHSAIDDRWSKSHWYESGFSYNISLSELQKIIFIYLTNNYQ